MDITTKALLIQTFNVFIALLCSYFLFTFLKSKADIKHKGVQLGGAGAMFVVVFLILNNQLSGIQKLVKEGVAVPVKIENETGKGFKKNRGCFNITLSSTYNKTGSQSIR